MPKAIKLEELEDEAPCLHAYKQPLVHTHAPFMHTHATTKMKEHKMLF